jgi:ribosomal protein L22
MSLEYLAKMSGEHAEEVKQLAAASQIARSEDDAVVVKHHVSGRGPGLDRTISRSRSGACALRSRSCDLGTRCGRLDPLTGPSRGGAQVKLR